MENKNSSSKSILKSQLFCRICGDIARGYNFDVITCMSCKAFFRRNARQASKFSRCEHQSFCYINKETRNTCATCRLKKCFAYGMNPDLIRSNKQNQIQFKSSMMNIQLPTPRPLNLLYQDHSTLTNGQWNLLSNIIRTYDEHHLHHPIKIMLNEKSSLPPKLRLKPKDTIHYINQIFEHFILLLSHSLDLRCLSSCACRALLTHNVFCIGNINGSFLVHESNALQNPTYILACKALFGDESITRYARDNDRFLSNGNIYKLFIFVLIFSSNCSIVVFNADEDLRIISSSIELIHVQNIYVTMLWKYLIYIYGHHGAVMCFTKIIKNVLDALLRMEHTLTNVAYLTISKSVSTLVQRASFLNYN